MADRNPSCSYQNVNFDSDSNSDESDEENSDEARTPPKKMKYYQKYNRRWEDEPNLKGWLQASGKGTNFAYCVACNIDIYVKNGKLQLYRHAQREKHKLSCRSRSKLKQRSLKDMMPTGLDTQVKDSELKLSAFIIEHNLPMAVMDHLPDLIRAVCPDSNIAKSIKSARTKTTNIIKNVIGTYSSQTLIETLRNNKFSLIIDETTDRTTMKHLCLVTRVILNDNISDCFLTLLPVESAQAEVLYQQIVTFFVQNNIPYLDNLIGFAADGASNMMGRHNSVASRFLDAIPNIFILKCICHSFALCAPYACSKLPNYVEALARDVHNYFSNSPKRIVEFKAFQDFCNIKAHKILHPCQTRWLSLVSVVQRLLEQYNALVLFFTDVSFNNQEDIHANRILGLLKNPVSKLYLQFLDYILPLFVNLNRQMQSENPQISNIYTSITTIVKTFLDCFIKKEILQNNLICNIDYQNPRNMLPLDEMYFGAAIQTCNLGGLELQGLKTTCLSFYIEGVKQILQRFPLKNNLLENLSFLNPQNVRLKSLTSIAHIAAKWPSLIEKSNLQTLDNEWRLLKNFELIPTTDNIFEFWSKISKIKCGDNTYMFSNLTDFVFKLLILPHSSANVERVFSTINLLKTKQRNRLGTDTIMGLLHSKRLVNSSTCFNFKSNPELRRLMTKDMYKEN